MPRRPTNSDGDSLSSESRRKEKKKLQRLAKKKEGTESSKLSQTVLNSYSGPLPVEEKVDLLSERYKPSRKNEHRKSKISPISEESEAESGEVSSGKPRVKKRHHRKRRDYSSVDERVDDSDEDDRPHRSSRKHKGERSRHHRHSRRRDSSYSDSPSRRNSRDSPEPIRRSRHDARESVRRSRRSPERRSRQNSSGSDRRPSSPSRGSKHGRSSHRSENRPSSHYSSTYRPDYPTYGVSRRSSSSHGSSPRVSSKSLRHGKHRDRRRSRHSTSSESEVTRNAPQKSVRALLAGENNRSKPVKTPLLQFSVVHRLQKGSKYQLYLCGNVPELGGSADPHSVGKGGIPLDSTDSKGGLRYSIKIICDIYRNSILM